MSAGVVMPDFTQPSRLGRHVLDTALVELRARGVPDHIVRIHAVPSGGRAGVVVAQRPAPGEKVDPRDGVHLYVEYTGVMDRLPYALRDEDPYAFGTDQVLGLFDSPAAHVGHFLRLGGDLFALRPGDDRSARRWLDEVLGIDPALFHRSRWYPLVRFAARLHAFAGLESAVPAALFALYGLSSRILRIDVVKSRATTPPAGPNFGQLGFSSILSGTPTTGRSLLLEIGPMPLEQFVAHQAGELEKEREYLYRLCVPHWVNSRIVERWRVEPAPGGTRLDASSTRLTRLGWTSYLANGVEATSGETRG